MINVSSIRNVGKVAEAFKEVSLEKLKKFSFSDLMLYKTIVSAFGALVGMMFVNKIFQISLKRNSGNVRIIGDI